FDGKPAWSPDGLRLAFISNREAGAGDFDIYVMEADGRGPRRLSDNNMIDDEPKWSPDGHLIVYQTQLDGNFELFTNSVTTLLSRPTSGNTTGIRALAVLPLVTLGASGDEQYLGVGIADMLINKLGQLDEMTLRTPAAVRRYLGTTKTALEAGRELGVDYVLAGSVERVGDRVRASLELTGTAEGRVMWAEQFDERFTDIPALQSSISERVARALSLELTSDERRRLGKRDTEDSEAHQLYLAGRYHLGKRTAEGLRQAITNFESAIARDSRFALAHAGLADCYALLNWYVEPPPADAFARARQAALRAVEYDDNLAEAHASLAFVKFHYERDWAGAELEFRRAINLNPLYPTARHWYAFNLSAAGRHDDAIAEVRRAAELDPRSAVIATALANVLYHARRFDEAIEQCQQALRLDPGSVAAHVVLRWAYEQKGQHDAAYAVYEKERAFAGDTPTTRAKLAHVLAAAKRTAEARTVLSELLASPRQRGAVTPYEIAVIYSLLDDKENALAWLEQAAKGHAVGFSFVRVDPHLDNLRADHRFAGLLRANGFGN
ncbi:MAG: tetratricopeptide repeat protein, partial [Acidobacteriota bacterium]|nr:tetratricopeptide repeat protein [Acidobacteriota bacterium]